ncbi:restriction endonuclease subunit S [Bacteroidales bacterium OttesenSCG-928-A17]|nr:restriction endonuclease subunit S [Bacteroidales bacterium OttesenSCG-928-A17]
MTYIKDGYSNESKFDIKQWKDVKSGFTHFQNNDLGIAKITPCFENRKSVIFVNLQNGHGAGTTELHIFRPFVFPLLSQYALYIAKSEDFISNGVANFSGAVGQQRVGKDIIGDYLIALPPLKEISKILSALSELFLIVDGIEKDKMQLSICIQNFKSKILDLAIRGKLVPQDPNDEPASVLLERIKAEHPESKKKAKNISDNSHYGNLPLNSICQLINTKENSCGIYPYLDVRYLRTKDSPNYKHSGRFVEKGTILILVDGENSGEVFKTNESGYMGSTFRKLSISNEYDENFVLLFIKNYQRNLRESKTGSAIPHLNKKMFAELQIPLISINMQKRIVKRIASQFEILDLILSNI